MPNKLFITKCSGEVNMLSYVSKIDKSKFEAMLSVLFDLLLYFHHSITELLVSRATSKPQAC